MKNQENDVQTVDSQWKTQRSVSTATTNEVQIEQGYLDIALLSQCVRDFEEEIEIWKTYGGS